MERSLAAKTCGTCIFNHTAPPPPGLPSRARTPPFRVPILPVLDSRPQSVSVILQPFLWRHSRGIPSQKGMGPFTPHPRPFTPVGMAKATQQVQHLVRPPPPPPPTTNTICRGGGQEFL